MTLDQLQRLKSDISRMERELERADGAIEQMESRLNKEFECQNLKQAEILLENLKLEEQEKKQESDDSLQDFEAEFKEKLDA